MRKIIYILSLIIILSVSCKDEIIEKNKDIQEKEISGQTVNFDDIDTYEVGELMDISTDIVLPKGSQATEEEMNVSSFVSETAQVVNTEAGYVLMADNAEGKTMLLGYALPPEQVRKSLSHKPQLIASKATYNNSEISCRSTVLTLVMMSLGDIGDIDCAVAMTKVVEHNEFPELVAKFSDKFINNPLYLEEINNDTEIKQQIKRVAKEVLNELIALEIEQKESFNGVEASGYTGLVDNFNWLSSWDKYEPWNWYGEANIYNVYDAPFLAISEKSNVPLIQELAIANPANINFIADFYDESGEYQDYKFIGRNSTLIQKAVHSGAAQTVVLTDVDFKDGFDKNKTYKVVIRKCLGKNWDKTRYNMLRLCHALRVAESVINIVAEGEMFKLAQDVITTKEAIISIGKTLSASANSINLVDIKSPSNITSIVETALNILGHEYIRKRFTQKTLKIAAKSGAKIAAKTSNPAGWAMIIFDAVNDFLPMAVSMAATPEEVEYSFNLSQNKVFVDDVPNVSVVNISPNNGQTKVDNPVTFTWDGSAENFQLITWATDDPSEIIHFPKSPSKSQTVKTLDFGKEYNWQVIAYGKDGYIKKGPIWKFTMANGENQKPTKPVAMYPRGLSDNIPTTMRFEWTKSTDPNPDDLLQYKLTYFYEKGGKVVEKVEKILEETHYDAKLKAGQTYYWTVVTIDDRGAKALGNSYAFTTIPNTAPSKPVLIGPADNTTGINTKVDFTWKACSDVDDDNITYEITVQTGVEVKVAITQNTIYSLKLDPSKSYTWYVTADDNNGGKTRSDSYSFTTEANHLPTAPVLLKPANGVTNAAANVTFEWSPSTDVDGEEVSYTLFIVTPNGTKERTLKGTSHTEKLELDTEYKWFVKANDATNIYVESDTFEFRTVQSNSSPLHIEMVKVPGSKFEIGKYEVTQALWKEIMNNNPSRFKGDNLPVESMTYYEINQFIVKLNEKTGRKYRLPSSKEWSLASKGGDASEGYTYSGSNNIEEVAWYKDNSENKTHPVGTKNANEIGIHDMSGNVSEWTSNFMDHHSMGMMALARGGEWSGNSNECTTTYSGWWSAWYYSRHNAVGFRLSQHN